MKNENIYINPQVTLLHKTPLGVAEVAGRTAYDSFDKSEHEHVRSYPLTHKIEDWMVPESKLLHQLAWVHFHHSVLEHVVLQFHIRDISRGVLQELARHRIASLTVRSSRYTLGPIVNAYIIAKTGYFSEWIDKEETFIALLSNRYNPLVTKEDEDVSHVNPSLWRREMLHMYDMLSKLIGTNYDEYLSSAQIDILDNIETFDPVDNAKYFFQSLNEAKQKRNVGDNLKTIVSDNFKTELVWTINLRSLKNFLDLRDSGAAWFPIRELAQEIKRQIPDNYKELIVKAK